MAEINDSGLSKNISHDDPPTRGVDGVNSDNSEVLKNAVKNLAKNR